MPPRFDRDGGMHNVTQMMGSSNGAAMCNGANGANGGLMTNGNVNSNGLINNLGVNGPIGTVSASLRKPLLEINGLSIQIYHFIIH